MGGSPAFTIQTEKKEEYSNDKSSANANEQIIIQSHLRDEFQSMCLMQILIFNLPILITLSSSLTVLKET